MRDSLRYPCTRWETALSDWQPDDLSLDRQSEFYQHMASCADCEAALHDYFAVDTILRHLPSVKPSPELPSIIVQEWEGEDSAKHLQDSDPAIERCDEQLFQLSRDIQVEGDLPTLQSIDGAEVDLSISSADPGECSRQSDCLTTGTAISQLPIKDRAHAIIISVDQYESPHLPDLPASAQNAHALRALLTDRCGYAPDHIELLTGASATVWNVRAALHTLADRSGPDTFTIIYFSGHGACASEKDKQHGYLCLRETNPPDLEHTAFSDTEFASALRAIRSRSVLVLLDICHNGGLLWIEDLGTRGKTTVQGLLPQSTYDIMRKSKDQVIVVTCKYGLSDSIPHEDDCSGYRFMHYFFEHDIGSGVSLRDLLASGYLHILDLFQHLAADKERSDLRTEIALMTRSLTARFPIASHEGNAETAPVMEAAGEVAVQTEQRPQEMLAPHHDATTGNAQAVGDYHVRNSIVRAPSTCFDMEEFHELVEDIIVFVLGIPSNSSRCNDASVRSNATRTVTDWSESANIRSASRWRGPV
jgi:hypothetical protein